MMDEELESGQEQDVAAEFIVDDGLDVEVYDDTPEQDRRPVKTTPEEREQSVAEADDEAEQYSRNVQKRIKKLTSDFHEERRERERLAREQAALADYAKRTLAENAALKRALQSGQTLIADQMKNRVKTDLELAKKSLKEAMELGDIDKQVAAQEAIARLTVENEKVSSFKPVAPPEAEAYVPPREPVNENPAPKPDAKALDWHRKNSWFGRDQLMTDYAKHVHDRLVVFDRVDPSSGEYWEKLDAEMAKRFPHLGGDDDDDTPAPRRSNVVAPVKRSTTPPRKIQLSSSEVAIAKRLGLSLEQYAAEKLKGTNG